MSLKNPYTHCHDPECDCADCLQWNAFAEGAEGARAVVAAMRAEADRRGPAAAANMIRWEADRLKAELEKE